MDAIDTQTFERNGRTYRVSLYHDGDAPNPLEDWDEMGTILSLNRRHRNFDPEGVEAAIDNNPDAVALTAHGDRLVSAYGRGDRRFWIITEADRSVTTVLLAESVYPV
jgi:hypothetical protein